MALKTTLGKLLFRTPLLGRLFECSSQCHLVTFKELFATFFFTITPLLIGITISYFNKEIDDHNFFSLLFLNLKNGELILYCNSLIIPVFAINLARKKHAKLMPYALFQMLTFFALTLVFIIVFVLQKTNFLFNQDTVLTTSYIFLPLSVLLLYISMVFKNDHINPAARFKQDENSFADRFNSYGG